MSIIGLGLCWNIARGLSMYLIAPDGSPAHGDFLFDCVPPPPKEGNVYAFIGLERAVLWCRGCEADVVMTSVSGLHQWVRYQSRPSLVRSADAPVLAVCCRRLHT
jgi:hypothetical protein